ncbi:hypothetical protein CORC01_07683 [Colletotrichum orchidophilum]|uniref:Uncharacterized protein n=1 Tax=Colletotrichum orchidophilum TaxID=1209926 RepID=A0A1G4B6R0_9PEZI|nr:uncharacterized protein CORC01_07683 [Colletotrichum orchidophilum]OHE97074.1 hypothetical protein CORC01_07683 [Colletotrichum orchidophilum]
MPPSLLACLPQCTSPMLPLPPQEPSPRHSGSREPLFSSLPTCHTAVALSPCVRCNLIQNAAVARFMKDSRLGCVCVCVCVSAQHLSEPGLR